MAIIGLSGGCHCLQPIRENSSVHSRCDGSFHNNQKCCEERLFRPIHWFNIAHRKVCFPNTSCSNLNWVPAARQSTDSGKR